MKQIKRQNSIWLVVPAVCLAVVDILFTLMGQSRFYWSGHFVMANEQAPHADYLLRQHPFLFLAVLPLYFGFIALVGLYLPARIARICVLTFVIGHTWGASSWMQLYFNYWMFLLFFLLVSWGTLTSFEKAQQATKNNPPNQ